MQDTSPTFWHRFSQWFTGLFHKQAVFDPQEKDGVWYQVIKPGLVRVGISAMATDDIGTISFLDFSTDETAITTGDDLVELEGEKAVETLKSPVTGQIINRNSALISQPELVNQHQPKENWLVEVQVS